MTNAYPRCPVGDITENFDAGRRPVKASNRRPGPYPYYGAQGIVDRVDGYLFEGEFVLVAEDGENLRSRNEPIALLANGKFWVNNHAHILRGDTNADTRFLFYAINASDISGYVTGSTIPKLSQGSLNRLLVPCPPIREQRAIASTLGALDDKIDVNHRMNETLEAMARAIFKDWFIDFGPTRAKMEGRAPYLAPDIWALFPDRLTDQETPVGWPVRPLRHFGDTSVGGYWGDDQPQGEEAVQFVCLRGVDLEHLRSSGSCPEAPLRWGKSNAVSKRPITECDVLVAGSGAGPCGRPLWLSTFTKNLGSLPITYSNFVKRITCTSPAAACFLDRLLHEMRLSREIWSYVNGTSVPNLNDQGLLDGKMIASPNGAVLCAFMEFVHPIQAKLFSRENVTLAATRDLLLPKLMSGEIRVKDAERVAEAAL